VRSFPLVPCFFVLVLSLVVHAEAPPLSSEPAFTTHVVSAEEVTAAKRQKTSVLRSLFRGRVELIVRFNRIDPRFVRVGTVLRVPKGIRHYDPMPIAWPSAASSAKSIVIALDPQFLAAYEAGTLVASYPISSGRPGFETPVGRFSVTKMDEDHASSVYPEETGGGWPMPHALRFHRSEYWIHGGELKGFPDSHGCVRLLPKDAKALYAWAGIGIPVRVVATLPAL